MVNQIRCLSSVALEKFARLRLLAMLSARDAMGRKMPCLAGRLMPPPPLRSAHIGAGRGCKNPRPAIPDDYLAARAWAVPFLAAANSGLSLATMMSTAPPAFSTAATAPFDAPATLKLTFVENSP